MLFINYAVPPRRLRPLVPEQFELDLQTINNISFAFISAVAFKNEDIKAGVLPLPEYDQINYRAYILHGEERAVYFFDMNVDSRVIATGTTFLGLPVGYEEIEICADEEKAGETRVSVTSSGPQGLAAEVVSSECSPSQPAVPSTEFFTERPVGYVKAPAGGLLKVVVEHEKIAARSAHAERARALFFESFNLLSEEESRNPHSTLYVKETLFDTSPPALILF